MKINRGVAAAGGLALLATGIALGVMVKRQRTRNDRAYELVRHRGRRPWVIVPAPSRSGFTVELAAHF